MIESDYLKESQKLIEDLKRIPALEPFRESDLRSLLRLSKIRKYDPNEMILKEGTHDTWIYFLVYGKVRIVKGGSELAVLGRRGDLFGEMGVLDGSARSASAIAATRTVCLATDTTNIDRLSGQDKTVFCYILYRIFAEILAARLRETSEALIKSKGKKYKFW